MDQSRSSISSILADLKLCTRSRNLEQGQSVHKQVVDGGYATNHYVCSSLINMYSKCGSMVEASKVFQSYGWFQSVVSWNCLIQGYVDNGQSEKALELFDALVEDQRGSRFAPDARTYVSALTACASLVGKLGESSKKWSEKGKSIHSRALLDGCVINVFVQNTLIDMYSNLGSMVQARIAFDCMTERSVVSWTALLDGYVENGESEVAVELFLCMDEEQVVPDSRTYLVVLTACASLVEKNSAWLEKGRSVFSRAAASSCSDIFVENMLINMFVKGGRMREARHVFDKMVYRDVVTWNTLLQGYAENGESELALEVFDIMRQSGTGADARSYVGALTACATLASLEKGRTIHSQALQSGHGDDLFVQNTLVDMYSKCGRMVEARYVFDNMKSRDVVSWNVLLQGYVANAEHRLALQLVDHLLEEEKEESCVPDARTYATGLVACTSLATENKQTSHAVVVKARELHSRAVASHSSDKVVETAMVNLYVRCGALEDARRVFDGLVERDIVSWNCFIQGHVDNGEYNRALQLVSSMDVRPDPATFTAALSACASLTAEQTGRELHAEIQKCGWEEDDTVATCLVEFYSKCGKVAAAERVFDYIRVKNTWAWNNLMSGFTSRGHVGEVLELFEAMRECKVKPNEITFSHILTACSHAGMTEQGKELLRVMPEEYGLSPDVRHYTCVIDLLGRANRVEEMFKFVTCMPLGPNAVTWTAILSSWLHENEGKEIKIKRKGNDLNTFKRVNQ